MRARGNIAQLLGDRVLAPDCRDPVVASEFSVMSQDVNFDGGLEVNLAAQRITGALMRYYKTVTTGIAVTSTMLHGRIFPKTLAAGVKVGGAIARAITKALAAAQGRIAGTIGYIGGAALNVGPGADNRPHYKIPGNTLITLNNPADKSGTVRSVQIYAALDLVGCKVGVFYLVSGTTYKCRSAATIGSVTAGSTQTFSVTMAITAGDLIGIYFSDGGIDSYITFYSGVMKASGDHCTVNDSTVYAADGSGDIISLHGTGTSPL
jgi:hypothetical protein